MMQNNRIRLIGYICMISFILMGLLVSLADVEETIIFRVVEKISIILFFCWLFYQYKALHLCLIEKNIKSKVISLKYFKVLTTYLLLIVIILCIEDLCKYEFSPFFKVGAVIMAIFAIVIQLFQFAKALIIVEKGNFESDDITRLVYIILILSLIFGIWFIQKRVEKVVS